MSLLRGSRTRKPKARTAELLVEELGEEVLVYDQRTDQVHCLSSAAQQVWRACDGETPVEELGSRLNLDSELVAHALGELEACGLLDEDAADSLTRREATGRLAKIGAAAAAAPLIYSIAAPAPAAAATLATCFATGACNASLTSGTCTATAGCVLCKVSGGKSNPSCNSCVPSDCAACTGPTLAAKCATVCGTGTTFTCPA